MEVPTIHIFRKESEFWKHSPVAARTKEYSPNHNFFINAYFGKLFLGYLIACAMNKTHILFFQYSLWFDQKIYLKIHVVILQEQSCSDPTATEFL